MKRVGLPDQHEEGLEWGHCTIELGAEESNQTPELVCISVSIVGKSASLFYSFFAPVECFDEIFTWSSPTLP